MKKVTALLLHWFNRVLEDKAHGYKARIEHDLGKIFTALIDGNHTALIGVCPKIQCPEFDDLAKAIIELYEVSDEEELFLTLSTQGQLAEGVELDFFTGKEVPTNPLNKMPNILPVPTATPGGSENLANWLSLLNGSEALVGLTAAQMTLNLCRKIVDEAMGKATKRDAHWINS